VFVCACCGDTLGIHVYLYACLGGTHVYVCMLACVRECTFACMCVCVCVTVCGCVLLHVHTCVCVRGFLVALQLFNLKFK